MKNYWYLLLAVVAFFAACEGGPGADVDARDAFVGSYTFETTGDMDLYVSGVKVYNIPMDGDGSFKIVKEGKKDSVVIVGALIGGFDSIHAVVNGNKIELESNSYNYDNGTVSLKVTLSNIKAPIVNDTIVWETDIMGMGTYSSYSITGDGHLKLDASKRISGLED